MRSRTQECDLDVKSVAVAGQGFSKRVIAALGIVAPANRLATTVSIKAASL